MSSQPSSAKSAPAKPSGTADGQTESRIHRHRRHGQEHGRAARGEQNERVGGRFLERLEKGVGRAGAAEAHALGVENNRDLERRDEGPQVKFAFEFADLLNRDVARF